MKKYINLISVTCFVVFLTSCAMYSTFSAYNWDGYEMPPSQILENGEEFFGGKLSDGSKFSVFYDEKISDDAEHYYVMLMQDFGWSYKGDKTWTAPENARTRKHGHIYIDSKRKVAVYFYPDRTYNAFKVNIY